MSNSDDILPAERLRIMQIIAGALLLGVVIFLAVALLIVLVQNNGTGIASSGDTPLISIVAVLFLAVTAPVAFILPRLHTRTVLRQIASGTRQPAPGADPAFYPTGASELLPLAFTSMLLGLANLEGAAFLGCIAYLMEARPFTLGVVLVAVTLMLVRFPTESRVRAWLERQADQLAELRQQRE